MIQGMYYEESAVCVDSAHEMKVWKVLHVFQWIFIVLSVLGAFFLFLNIPSVIETGKDNQPAMIFTLVTLIGGFASIVLIAVMFWRLKLRRNISYDYVFVEDELRVSKVFNGKKRKFLYKLKADEILKIGYYDRPSFDSLSRGYDKKHIVLLTPNQEPAEGKTFIYIAYSSSLEKTLYIIESRELILEYLVRAAGRNKFERQ